MAENKPIQLERESGHHSTNYAFLRKKAIERVQELSGDIWTDYNLHDPGVTILEQLCYAITDLGYRTDFVIEDILADSKGNIDATLHSFFSKAAILTCAPVTSNDYRKLIIDEIDQVENVWLEPAPGDNNAGSRKGVFNVFVQADDNLAAHLSEDPTCCDAVIEDVRACVQAHRNVGQDFGKISLLLPQEISIKAEVIVDWKMDAQEIMAKVCNAFEFALHPPVRFFTEAELIRSGHKVEDIYTGPLLKKGFVIDADLKPRRKEIDPTELVKAVSMVAGVIKVKSLSIAGADNVYTNRPIAVKEGYYPFLEIAAPRHDIRIFSDKYEERSKDAAFWNTYQQVKVVAKRAFVGQRTGNLMLSMKGQYRDIGKYFSIQHLFPHIYHTGEDNRLPPDVGPLKQAQVKQLKAYLLFFEQIMANYLAQLKDIGHLFSPVTDNERPATYAVQPLYEVPHVKELINAFDSEGETTSTDPWQAFMADPDNNYMKALSQGLETDKSYRERKHKILDHLLARFNMPLLKYCVTLYDQLYGDPAVKKRVNASLRWKSDVLTHIPALTSRRILSFNHLHHNGKEPLSGYEALIYKILHITADKLQPLTAVFNTPAWQVAVSRPSGQDVTWQERIYKHHEEELIVRMPDHEHANKRYDYGHQPLSFLKTGIDMTNYRIIFDEHSKEYLVIYKPQQQNIWTAVIKARSREKATRALKDMTRQLQLMSAASEGLYLVEHLLLRPSVKDSVFGFRLLSRKGRLMMMHAHWMDFEAREQLLQRLLHEMPEELGQNPAEIYQKWSSSCKLFMRVGTRTVAITTAHFQDKELADNAINTVEETLRYLRLLRGDQELYQHFECYVKYDHGRMLKEDFFRFRAAVVFPAWPARFQLPEFRNVAEELIKENTPVQLRLRFKWLGVAAMQEFESYYFPWREALQYRDDPNANPVALQLATAALIRYLAEDTHVENAL